MSTMGMREKAIVAMLIVAVFYAVAAFFGYSALKGFFSANPKGSEKGTWCKAAEKYRRAKKDFNAEEKLIGEKKKWTDAYEAEKAAMPTFAADKATDTTWLSKMDEMAKRHNVFISQRKSGQEVEGGDVLELPIEVSWEASLEGLVKFMHELENTSEGMFDMRVLNFKPSSKKGYLRGTFTLTCAYMREK